MRLSTISVVSLMGFSALAQSGDVDPSFAPIDLSGGTANGLNGTCWTIALSPDGKILVGGDFGMVNGIERERIARLNADGSLDLGFDPGYGANGGVRAIAVQADGKVVVGGVFTYFNGVLCNHLIRLMPDGSVDGTFDTAGGFDGNVNALLVRPDGDILVGGDFYHFNTGMSRGLACLDPDGGLDSDFNAGDIGIIYSMLPMPDGRTLIGGQFDFVSGVQRRCLAALDEDGSVDMSFAPFGWNYSPVLALALQSDGKVLAGGMLPGSIARMEANGELDPFFGSGVTGFGGWDPWVYDMAVQSDGKILCVGRFESYNGVPCRGMARLNGDGTPDETFTTGLGLNSDAFTLAVQPDGRALVGGFFTEINGTPQNRIARLFAEDLSTDVAAGTLVPLEIYPNPTTGQVYLRTDGNTATRISIFSPDGRLVGAPLTSGSVPGLKSIDLGSGAKGVYLVRLTEGTTVRTARLVVE